MILDEIKTYLGASWTGMESLMEEMLRSDISLLDSTNRSILSHSGKKIRPLTALLAAAACAAPGEGCNADSIRLAAASELLHNATLLHDDVADDSAQRRGRPTVLSMLGPSAAVLMGDFWLVKAMDCVLSISSGSGQAVKIFSKTLSDLAEGEMLQLEKSGSGDTVKEDYYRIIYSKTASLFEAAALTAALSVGAPDRERDAVRDYAVNLGMAFQIKDDILDYAGDGSVGKPVGIDLRERKITLPLLGALESVSEEEAAAMRRKVCGIAGHPEYEEELRRFVQERDGIGYAETMLAEFSASAVTAIRQLRPSRERDYLEALVSFVSERNA